MDNSIILENFKSWTYIQTTPIQFSCIQSGSLLGTDLEMDEIGMTGLGVEMSITTLIKSDVSKFSKLIISVSVVQQKPPPPNIYTWRSFAHVQLFICIFIWIIVYRLGDISDTFQSNRPVYLSCLHKEQ